MFSHLLPANKETKVKTVLSAAIIFLVVESLFAAASDTFFPYSFLHGFYLFTLALYAIGISIVAALPLFIKTLSSRILKNHRRGIYLYSAIGFGVGVVQLLFSIPHFARGLQPFQSGPSSPENAKISLSTLIFPCLRLAVLTTAFLITRKSVSSQGKGGAPQKKEFSVRIAMLLYSLLFGGAMFLCTRSLVTVDADVAGARLEQAFWFAATTLSLALIFPADGSREQQVRAF